eukprot:6670361-Pyramimonas_sp.AAC.1
MVHNWSRFPRPRPGSAARARTPRSGYRRPRGIFSHPPNSFVYDVLALRHESGERDDESLHSRRQERLSP